MKKGILIILVLITIALVIGAVMLIKKPTACTGSSCSVPTGTNTNSATGNVAVSTTLDSLSSDVATSDTNDTAITSDTNVVDTTGLG